MTREVDGTVRMLVNLYGPEVANMGAREQALLLQNTLDPVSVGTDEDVRRRVLAVSRAVTSVRCTTPEPGVARVRVRLRWWAWLGLGLVHRSVRRRVLAGVDTWCPVGARVEVTVR